MPKVSEHNGIVVIDKPAGITSHDVVNRARRLFKTKRVGHTGTLDPDATGVLVLCIGYATRVAEYLSSAHKSYVAEVVFGLETDTQDASGNTIAERSAAHITQADVQALCARFTGKQLQTPPMVSALHHEGKRLYELAREGITVERTPREIEISECLLLEFTAGEHPCARIAVTCSTGTYIRTLSADMGEAVGTGAVMHSLRRTQVGTSSHPFTLENAFTLEQLQELAESDRLAESVIPLRWALQGWLQIPLPETSLRDIQQGRTVMVSEKSDVERVAICDSTGEVVALGNLSAGALRPTKVLVGGVS